MRAKNSTRKLVLAAMFAALAFIVTVAIPHIHLIPTAAFLSYDTKDVILAICGFTLGPIPALTATAVVSFLEMLTVSGTGPIGFVMNLLSSAAFVLPASILYKRKHTLSGAAAGLTLSIAVAVVTMLLWNYFITPLYMGVPRETVAKMLLSAFLPFNFIKAALNAAITMLVYKPVSRALRQLGLLGSRTDDNSTPKEHGRIAALIAALVLAACIVAVVLLSRAS